MKTPVTPSRPHILRSLFFSTLYLSAFTFGGGYVIVTLMKKKFVDDYHWIDEPEMLDLIAIAQSSPGAIAVNGAIVIGYKLAGIAGVLTAVLATVLPPFVILSVISVCYTAFRSLHVVSWMLKGMQAGVAAVILDVVAGLGGNVIKTHRPVYYLIMVGAFVATFFLNVNVIYIILGAAVIGIILELASRRKGSAA